jgi:transcription antitermination factor NusG
MFIALVAFNAALLSAEQQKEQAAAETSQARVTGTINSISGNNISVKADSGSELTVVIQDSTRILRISSGQKDPKNVQPIQARDIQAGDRILVHQKPGSQGNSIVASTVMIMKQEDVAQKEKQERDDWSKRGVGGLVSAIRPSTGIITVAIMPGYSIDIKTSKNTKFLRYAPGSVKYSDAVPGNFSQIKVGDQLVARGDRSADGTQVSGDEVATGAFRNIAGTVVSVDLKNQNVKVSDLLTKKSVSVTVGPAAQLRKLTPLMAESVMAFVRSTSARREGNGSGQNGQAQPPLPARPPDFARMLGRVPPARLSDLQKGDAVIIVAMQDANDGMAAITMVGGIEPILSASPKADGVAALLSRWNITTATTDIAAQ